MTERKTYDVTASKDGRWWLVQVPELDTVGQARSAAEVEEVAREVIGLWLDVEPDTFDVAVSIEIPGEAREAWEEAKQREAVAREENAAAAMLARQAVASLRADGLTFKDAGVVLGLTAQRVQQLAADIVIKGPAGSTAVVEVKSGRSNTTRSKGGEIRAASKGGRRRAGV